MKTEESEALSLLLARVARTLKAHGMSDSVVAWIMRAMLESWEIGVVDGGPPVADCGHKGEDGCCQHPQNITPECHRFACPICRSPNTKTQP